MEQTRCSISIPPQTSKRLLELIRYYKQNRSAVIARVIDEYFLKLHKPEEQKK